MLMLKGITYTHPNKDILFTDLSLVVNRQDKLSLIGNNGTGKSTLLKLMSGLLQPLSGTVTADGRIYYVPQHFGQFDDHTVVQAMQVANKLDALEAILAGDVSEQHLATLNDDWSIEERCADALAYWQLSGISLSQKMGCLSGGQKTKVFLAGAIVHQPDVVLLDEPGNHLDAAGRAILYDYISATSSALVVVSHDRALLDLLPATCELSKAGLTTYGGNYSFYTAQKAIEQNAFQQELHGKEKELRKAKEIERQTNERRQKLDARGKKKQEKAGLPTISMNTLRNNAEKSSARIKGIHAGKIDALSGTINDMRRELPDADKMKLGFADSQIHKGKQLVSARSLNYAYGSTSLWPHALNFDIVSGRRYVIKGNNGAGKTTLVRLILDTLQPTDGTISHAGYSAVYIDQDYSLISDQLSVVGQAQRYNTANLPEHELRSRLTHFLFTEEDWDKPCGGLSGGERMRLMLCCLTLGNTAPDMIILDEPVNNLDIQSIAILTNAINGYKGTLLIVSHDSWFVDELGIEESIDLIF